MHILDAIYHYQNVIPEKFCKNIIEYADLVCVDKAKVMMNKKNVTDTKTRNVLSYFFQDDNQNDILYKSHLFSICGKAINHYATKFTFMNEQMKLEAINLLKYSKGHFYQPHVDAHFLLHRQLSIIINLNNEYDGGKICFHDNEKQHKVLDYKLDTGDLLVFPSTFLYPHSVDKITKGVRYSMVAWFN
tara:strand:+ start:829 stop:1392 length:564 start_codon:yes stop_codon:yes gene_type:complete